MYKHHVECWTHWLWIWLTVGRAPGVKAGSRAALLPGVGILYIYIYMIYICHIFNIWKYRIHSSYLHISTCLWFKKMIIWMRIYTSIWCARSADGFTTLLQLDATRAGVGTGDSFSCSVLVRSSRISRYIKFWTCFFDANFLMLICQIG